MDFPLALPVLRREHGKRNWERCLGVAYDPLGAAANSRSRSAWPPTRRKRAAVLATVKMLWGGKTVNDFSRCLDPLDMDATLIAVIEMSQSSWLVAGIVPGGGRRPRSEATGSPASPWRSRPDTTASGWRAGSPRRES
jgi:hypothetical protein